MSKVYFCGDLHLGHKNITKFRFLPNGDKIESEEHDQLVVDNILSTTSKKDKLFILGDVCFNKESFDKYFKQIIDYIPNITICLGNHDIDSVVPYKLYLDNGVNLASTVYYKNFILSHIPVHPSEFNKRIGNIHGHLHDCTLPNKRYYCVSMESELCNMKPISFESIVEELRSRIEAKSIE